MAAFMRHEALRDTAQHIAVLQRKIDQLLARRDEAWAQLLAATLREYDECLTEVDLADMLADMKASYGNGFGAFWNAHMPDRISWQRVRSAAEQQRQWSEQYDENVRLGFWSGAIPLTGGYPVPRRGVSVVYVLFDMNNRPCYVGSTDDFKRRLKQHCREKADLARWMAYVCPTRDDAYQLEVKLLNEHKPYMNKKRGR